MPEPIDSDKLKALAERVWTLLGEYEMDAEMFTLAVRVSPEFYRSIKENFPNRHELDITVGSGEENWHINLICSPFER